MSRESLICFGHLFGFEALVSEPEKVRFRIEDECEACCMAP